mmetsp:Transcript_23993/g.72068  ORF Transcript_23993/g.72068 Transcript_23993/m.72068 type:complete len:248 (+) Transcript_23993:1037-1780(+)
MRNGRLRLRSLDGQCPLDPALLWVRIAGPGHGLRAQVRHTIIHKLDMRSRPLERRVHLPRFPASHRDEGFRILGRRKRSIHLECVLGFPVGGDFLAQRFKLEARAGHEVHPVIIDVRLVTRRSDGHCAPVGAHRGVNVLEGDALRRMSRRFRRGERPRGLQRVLRVDQAATDNLSLEGVVWLHTVEDDLLQLLHRQLWAKHPHQSSHAADMRGGHRRAAQVLVLVVGDSGVDLAPWCGDVYCGVAVA